MLTWDGVDFYILGLGRTLAFRGAADGMDWIVRNKPINSRKCIQK